jgi:hypothetical protein
VGAGVGKQGGAQATPATEAAPHTSHHHTHTGGLPHHRGVSGGGRGTSGGGGGGGTKGRARRPVEGGRGDASRPAPASWAVRRVNGPGQLEAAAAAAAVAAVPGGAARWRCQVALIQGRLARLAQLAALQGSRALQFPSAAPVLPAGFAYPQQHWLAAAREGAVGAAGAAAAAAAGTGAAGAALPAPQGFLIIFISFILLPSQL